ncbi:uncharacterized protein [Anabrus simplex]|uniref:uncharacterized protein isoform X2 n=1 Tax=Anabrus simplex TaxID=316456 RepID=UPI0035A3B426
MKNFSIFVLMFSVLCAETTHVFPDEVSVVTGEEVMLRLEDPNENQTICFITTPYGTTNYTLLKAGDEELEINPRFQYWGSGLKSGDCGVRIKNISVDDEGYWRLTSLRHDGRKRVGAAKVTVILSGDSSSDQYEVKVGSEQNIHLGPMESEYCQIVIPGDMRKSNLITGSCSLPVHKSMKIDSGNWTAMVGVRGKVEEVPASVSLSVEEERLDVGWEIFNHSESESISMYCNLRYSDKKVSFCRFLRLDDQVGFHLSDGLGSGKYSYFGNGLRAGDCGMTIEKPSGADYTKWQCILGVGPHVFPMAAFIGLKKQNEIREVGYGIQTFSREKVLEVVGTELIVMCRAEAGLKYCWLRHPNGTSLFPLDTNGTSEYQYAGRGLQMGECGIMVMAAKLTDSGVWECHMGAEQELVTYTKVKITAKSLTADQDVIKTLGSGNLTMLCQSVPIATNLAYCRFVRPDGYGFNVNENSSLLDHYSYYGHGLSKGECGLLLHTIEAEDLGQWTCAARLQGQATETSEIITIGLPDGSVASIGVGSAAALILALVCVFGMVLAARRNRRQRRRIAREQEEAASEEVEMMPV